MVPIYLTKKHAGKLLSLLKKDGLIDSAVYSYFTVHLSSLDKIKKHKVQRSSDSYRSISISAHNVCKAKEKPGFGRGCANFYHLIISSPTSLCLCGFPKL